MAKKFGFWDWGSWAAGWRAHLVKAGFDVDSLEPRSGEGEPLWAWEPGGEPVPGPWRPTATSRLPWCRTLKPRARCVSDPTASLREIGPGRGYVDMSTVDDATARTVAEAVTRQGGRYLEAPVSGDEEACRRRNPGDPGGRGPKPVRRSGSRLRQNGKEVAVPGSGGPRRPDETGGQPRDGRHAGGAVRGGWPWARRAGLDGAQILEVLAAGAMVNPMFQIKGPMVLAGDATPSFPLKHLQKDLRLALALARDVGQPIPTGSSVLGTFTPGPGGRVRRRGHRLGP